MSEGDNWNYLEIGKRNARTPVLLKIGIRKHIFGIIWECEG